ncbi:hypothetical protein FOZ62_030388, partial [Perkinsus olseni]
GSVALPQSSIVPSIGELRCFGMTVGAAPGRKQGYKLVLLGDASVGKTSLVQRFVHNSFADTVQTTIGAAFSTQDLLVPGSNRLIKFEIWDTAGVPPTQWSTGWRNASFEH